MSVIEDSKDQKDLITSQLAQAAQIQLSAENQQHLQQQTLTVQQLQQLQALDNVVRMENAMENHQNQNNESDPLGDNLHIVKDEKVHKFVMIICFLFLFNIFHVIIFMVSIITLSCSIKQTVGIIPAFHNRKLLHIT